MSALCVCGHEEEEHDDITSTGAMFCLKHCCACTSFQPAPEKQEAHTPGPCPFCDVVPDVAWSNGGSPRGYWVIRCDNDNCPVSSIAEEKVRDWDVPFEVALQATREKVISYWNSRPETARKLAEAERLLREVVAYHKARNLGEPSQALKTKIEKFLQ